MASPGTAQISPSDQKDLDKVPQTQSLPAPLIQVQYLKADHVPVQFIKYLAVKAVQVVVQARLGERVTAPSKPDTTGGTSWFNLAVKDNAEVKLLLIGITCSSDSFAHEIEHPIMTGIPRF